MFERELTELLNRYSQENRSGTPDFILAAYLINCLATWNAGVNARERFYGRAPIQCDPPRTPPTEETER